MKIRELVAEAGEFKQGYAAMDKALKPSSHIGPDTKAAYKKGFNAVDKMLSPSKWFDKSGSPDTVKSTAADRPQLSRVDIKTALQNAEAGQVYQNDVKVLTQIYGSVKSGAIKTHIDQASLLAALKTAYQQQPLDDNQQAVLSQFSKQFY